ncbi:HlyD family type I secretion periplasmic adaptor subunit [Endozoicomonas sp.]|uniref:HlyD family type I secretion periplasmic adaptor subunit n=1 Tax=Endozoicomonas sp. TaxID=1892382 RepID=UPI0028861479|nr:HlyD family type I secretion periplasmic adaptor subunit [Endozoicomonas sp.]
MNTRLNKKPSNAVYLFCQRLFSRHGITSLVLCSLLAFGLWARTTRIDTFVQGTGKVTSASDHKIVEHLEGGILRKLHVSEGQKIKEGSLLFTVENPKLLEITELLKEELLEKKARIKRLYAEMEGAEMKAPDLTVDAGPQNYLRNEWHLYQRRQASLTEQKALFDQKITRTQARSREVLQTIADLNNERSIAREQNDILETLISGRAGSKVNLLEKRMDTLKIQTRINQSHSKLQVIETELQALSLEKKQLDVSFKEQVQAEYNQETIAIALLEAQIKASGQRKLRSEVRSPVNGTLHRLATSTPGEVVSPGTVMAEIVPDNEPLHIEAQIHPRDRARIWAEQKVNIRVSAYDYSIHGTLTGTIRKISADTYPDDHTRENYYKVTITSDSNGFGPDKPLMQGMTVDINIVSGKQTVMSYLLPAAYNNQR